MVPGFLKFHMSHLKILLGADVMSMMECNEIIPQAGIEAGMANFLRMCLSITQS